MVFNFNGKDNCAAPKEIDLLVKALSEDELLPLAERWLEYNTDTSSAALERMDYIKAANIRTNADKLRFDATFDCGLSSGEVRRLTFRGMMVCDERSVWYHNVETYEGEDQPDDSDMLPADGNIVPIIPKDTLDDEATAFLSEFYPQALATPQAVPIKEVLLFNLDLVILNADLAEKLWIGNGEQPFGQIFFTDTPIDIRCVTPEMSSRVQIHGGTVFIDGARSIESEGCYNNTLAHEGFHWYRHCVYAAIHNYLHRDKPYIACRESARTPKSGKPWTDENRIEWQANSVAPRILMPKEPFTAKAREFMARRQYDCDNSVVNNSVVNNSASNSAALCAVIRDLAAFFAVSKPSAAIRLVEVGLISRKALNAAQLSAGVVNCLNTTTSINPVEAFREYRENADFRALLDTGAVQYVESRFVLNDKRYIADIGGSKALTNYARQHQSECCLTFTLRKVYPEGGFTQGMAFRHDSGKLKTEPRFESGQNAGALDVDEIKRLNEQFSAEFSDFSIATPTFTQIAVELMTKKHWNRAIFKERTLLDDSAYTRIFNGKTEKITARTVAAFCVGVSATQALAEKLFAAAGLAFNNSIERFAYSFLFGAMHGRPIDECNAFLESQGFEPLGVKQRDEPEAATR